MTDKHMHYQRRNFLRVAGGAVALRLLAPRRRAAAGVGPNERINVGFIGLGGQGTGRLVEFMKHPDVNVAAICDVDLSHVNRAVSLVEKRCGSTPARFCDFRRVLDSKDVDAVVIATPDHWHALTTFLACKAGKDVYHEKPLCHSIAEGCHMIQAATENKRITQLGIQMHNDSQNYRRVVEVVRSGALGKIDRVFCWMRAGLNGIGNPPDGVVPTELDYDLWLGPAPKRPYNPNRSHGKFRNFWDYSGGVFIDFWCHLSDVAYWALNLKAPKSVAAVGMRRPVGPDNGETPNLLEVLYEFPDGLSMTWQIGPTGLIGFETFDRGCVFQGSEATLFARYESYEVFAKGKRVEDFPKPPQTIPDSPGHIREFLDSIKSRQRTTCNMEYAHLLTKGGLLGNLAHRTGKRLYWDDQKEQIIGDPKTQQLVSRQYRKPWKFA